MMLIYRLYGWYGLY